MIHIDETARIRWFYFDAYRWKIYLSWLQIRNTYMIRLDFKCFVSFVDLTIFGILSRENWSLCRGLRGDVANHRGRVKSGITMKKTLNFLFPPKLFLSIMSIVWLSKFFRFMQLNLSIYFYFLLVWLAAGLSDNNLLARYSRWWICRIFGASNLHAGTVF